MNSIGGFLERYKNFIPPPLAAARAVQGAIRTALGIEVPEQAIKVRGGRADIQVGSLEKTEILLNKDPILAHTRTLIGDSVREIR